jgi:hypothetical protein
VSEALVLPAPRFFGGAVRKGAGRNQQQPKSSKPGSKTATSGSKTTAKRIGEVLKYVEGQLGEKKFKATVTDYIRLLQIYKEFEKESPKNIEVTWIEAPLMSESDAA